MEKSIFFIILCFLSSHLLSGSDVKYGKISEEEIRLSACEFEPHAEAVYLENTGEIKISRSKVFFKKHVRIKILKKAGLKHAEISIPYFSKNGYEKVMYVKAQTINIGEDQEITQIEVQNGNIFTAEISKNWGEKKFVFPGVKVGSIIEYEYRIVSDNFLYLNKWDFQNDLPTLHSAIKVHVPEKLGYQVLLQGHRLLKKYGNVQANYWELFDLPSVKPEPFLYNIHDYTEKIKFQLKGYEAFNYDFRNTEYHSHLVTWEELASNVMNSSEYNSFLNKSRYAKSVLNKIGLGGLSSIEKLKKIYQYVLENYDWNGKYRRFTYDKFNEVVANKTGYSSEINLQLTLLIQEAGIEAYPMLVSTRSHGEYVKQHPFLSQFNHLICYAIVDGKNYYLDATNNLRPYNLLSEEAYVKEGFVLDKSHPYWHSLDYHPTSTQIYDANISFYRPDSVWVELDLKCNGYKALEKKESIRNYGVSRFLGEEIFFRPASSMVKLMSNNIDQPDDTLDIKTSFTCTIDIDKGSNDKLFFNPVPIAGIQKINENPFTSKERYYPIQFPYPEKSVLNLKFIFYEPYELVEWPKSERIKLPNDYGEFSYTTLKIDNVLRIQIVMKTNKIEIPPSQYANLQKYYLLLTSKLNESLVLQNID